MLEVPEVGVGVIIIRGAEVILGKRKGVHGAGCWDVPGGHLEFGETWEECAKREVLEETSLKIKDVRFGAVTNDIFGKENKHYITIFMVAVYKSGMIANMEPEKHEEWKWFDWNNLPTPLFLSESNLLKQKFNPFG